jgi:hypothetical protein
MLSKILNHINDCEAHLAWRSKGAGVVALVPHAAASAQNMVHRSRNPDGETGHASPDRCLVACLDEQVHMVCLNGEMKNAKPGAGGLCKGTPYA